MALLNNCQQPDATIIYRRRDQQTARDNSIGFKVYKRSKQFSKQPYICLPRHLDRGSVLRSADWTIAELPYLAGSHDTQYDGLTHARCSRTVILLSIASSTFQEEIDLSCPCHLPWWGQEKQPNSCFAAAFNEPPLRFT